MAFQKGLILSRQKKFTEARQAFEAARTGSPENDRNIELQIAVSYAEEGKMRDAGAALKAVITRYPGTDAASFAQEVEQRISTALKGRGLMLYGGFSYLYDDNVILKAKNRLAAADARNENSGGASQYLRVEYDTAFSADWALNTQYLLQNSNYFRISGYDMFQHGLTVSPAYRSDSAILSLPLNISHTALDYRSYQLQCSLKPTGTFVLAPDHLFQVTGGYTRRTMSLAPVSPEHNRDADIASGQLGYTMLYDSGQGMFNLRGEIFHEDTGGREWRNLGSRLSADALIPLRADTRLIVSAEGVWQDYGDNTAGRRDTTLNATAAISQKLVDSLYLNLQYSYSRAMSNVDLYDYQRNLVTTGLDFRF